MDIDKMNLGSRADYYTGMAVLDIARGDLKGAIVRVMLAEHKRGYEAAKKEMKGKKK